MTLTDADTNVLFGDAESTEWVRGYMHQMHNPDDNPVLVVSEYCRGQVSAWLIQWQQVTNKEIAALSRRLR